ncbi:MAG TPA: DUF3866 family protein, partial [Solirubrobacterales bacterium]|nr:DUF3866 family protein [Solirubrobacterales bacterium]
SDPRGRHRGLSHHTSTVLDLLLAPVTVPLPSGQPDIAAPLEASQHHLEEVQVDVPGYAAANLPTKTMGRHLNDDPLFFAAPLAAGTILARVAR